MTASLDMIHHYHAAGNLMTEKTLHTVNTMGIALQRGIDLTKHLKDYGLNDA